MTKDEEKLVPEKRVAKKSRPTAGPLTDEDRAFVRELQEDVPLVPRPFDGMAKRLEMTVPELLEKIQWFQDVGLMRRFAAVLRHQNAGFTSNGMVCWKVPEEQIRSVGEIAASFPQVSHCYQRPTYPDWPYSLFSMVHSRSDDKCRKIAEQISEKTGITEYQILFSTRNTRRSGSGISFNPYPRLTSSEGRSKAASRLGTVLKGTAPLVGLRVLAAHPAP